MFMFFDCENNEILNLSNKVANKLYYLVNSLKETNLTWKLIYIQSDIFSSDNMLSLTIYK